MRRCVNRSGEAAPSSADDQEARFQPFLLFGKSCLTQNIAVEVLAVCDFGAAKKPQSVVSLVCALLQTLNFAFSGVKSHLCTEQCHRGPKWHCSCSPAAQYKSVM